MAYRIISDNDNLLRLILLELREIKVILRANNKIKLDFNENAHLANIKELLHPMKREEE